MNLYVVLVVSCVILLVLVLVKSECFFCFGGGGRGWGRAKGFPGAGAVQCRSQLQT